MTLLADTKRYRLICVAPEVPDRGSYADLDEAIVNSDAHFEVYDSEAPEGTSPWVGAYCQEDYDDARARYEAKAQVSCPDPNCREGVAGPDEQRCATCGGEG